MTGAPTQPPIPVAILAAGASRRLGAAKQLVRFGGRSLLAHAVATARAAGCGPVLVVLGAGADQLRGEVGSGEGSVIANPAWAEGMAASVRVAVGAVAAEIPDAPAILFAVCDQPLMSAELLREVVAAHRAGHDLVAAEYGGRLGVPALFTREYFGELLGLSGDEGARRVLARHAARVRAISFPGGVVDVDTPADAAALARLGPTPAHEPTAPTPAGEQSWR